MIATSQQRDRLRALLEPVVTAAGADIDDLTVQQAGRRSLVRVTVDADGGVDLDAVADVSRAINEALDTDEGASLFTGAYVLEVSSPGVDRPLTEPKHWRRAVGRLVTVDVDGSAVTARIVSASASGVTFGEVTAGKLSGSAGDEVAFAHLGAGRVQVEFKRKDQPNDEFDDELDDDGPADDETDDEEPNDNEPDDDEPDDDEPDDDTDEADDMNEQPDSTEARQW